MGLFSEKQDNYIRFFRFIIKYWQSDIFSDSDALTADLDEGEKQEWDHSPEELVADLKKMGPTYIKLGQLLSTRPDMLPKPYLKALASLQDDVESVSYKEIEQIFREDIGERTSKAFASFDPEPLASASIGQVHKAELNSGEIVAVKVQRPGIQKRFIDDLEVLMSLSKKAEKILKKNSDKFSVHEVIEELRYILLQELDYEKEAKNLKTLKNNLAEFKLLHVPDIIPDYCGKKVLTMEYIEGQKVTDVSPFQLDGLPKQKITDDFVKGYLKQIIVDGFAHADPHPGNVHLTKTGKLALMDLGMVVRFDEQMKEQILKLMIGLGGNDSNQVTKVLLEMSEYDAKSTDLGVFKKQVARKIQENKNSKAEDLKTGRSILDINKIAVQQGIKLPVALVSLGKILLNMDQIIAFLSPQHNLQKTVRKYMEHLMRHHMFDQLKSGNILQNILESKELMEELPYRINKITKDLTENKFKIDLNVFDEKRFILALQKVANRITTGLVVAALILGAALLMRVPTTWTILGYPGFAILLFIIAAFIGFYLIYEILFKDENNPE